MINKDEEQRLVRYAKKALTSDKYEEFIDRYLGGFDDFEKQQFAIGSAWSERSDPRYSAFLLSSCSEEERSDFWKITDSKVRVTVIDGVQQKTGKPKKLSEIIAMMQNPGFRDIEKIKRPLIFSTSDGSRPVGDLGVLSWNGFQVIDLDIKNRETAVKIRNSLFERLNREPWFFASVLSSSGKGVHIWTKIHVPEGLELEQMRTLFALNFRHKYSAVYIAIEKSFPELGSDEIISFMDFSMFKPQQGVFIPGQTPLVNSAFVDLPIMFESVHESSKIYNDQEWITAKPLADTFSKWEWFANHKKNPSDDIEYERISAVGGYALNGVKVHYKHAQRWQLANTLCSIYGFEESMKILRDIVSDDVPTQELRADLLTANNHNKPISMWAVKTLNLVHGFNIKVSSGNIDEEFVYRAPKHRVYDLWQENGDNYCELSLERGKYLSDISEDIKKNLGHISLLDAGAGFGKTEMVKGLGGKVMLVLPFTSIIESKFNDSEEWECFFQNRAVVKDDLEKYDKLCMTIDKFSRLNMMDVNFSYFDYIVLDESHLLFLSEYRPVMARAVDNLAHSASKVILMTGTPTGETIFFPEAKHIKVVRDEHRDKSFTVLWGNNRKDTRIQMASAMADAIMEGRKVLYPTNSGSAMYETLVADIDRFLFYRGFHRSSRTVYYKKSNEGQTEMDAITFKKTIADLDLVACTSYLSVGVDICDKYEFEIFFDRLMIAQDIEQYANRLRDNNLHINMYLPKVDDEDVPIDYGLVIPLTMEINGNELALARDAVKMCNALTLKAKGEYRYNPIIQSILCADKYIHFSKDLGLYYVDETAYKLHTFEDNYRRYASQLPVITGAMKHFGYEYGDIDRHAFMVSNEITEEIEALNKDVRRNKYKKNTIETFQFLRHLNDDNIDMLLEGLMGRFKIAKDENMETPFSFKDGTLSLRDPELFAKNMPIIKTLHKFYDFDTIMCVFDFCLGDASRQINYSMLNRVAKLVSIELNKRKGRVDVPIIQFMQQVKEWVEENNRRSQKETVKFLYDCTLCYVKKAGKFLLSNTELIKHTFEMINELFKVLVTKGKKESKTGLVPLTLNRLLWTEKNEYSKLYGNANTRIFFLGDLFKENKPEESAIPVPEIPEDYDRELDPATLDHSVVSRGFHYYRYADQNSIINEYYSKQAENYTFAGSASETVVESESTKPAFFEEPSLFSDEV